MVLVWDDRPPPLGHFRRVPIFSIPHEVYPCSQVRESYHPAIAPPSTIHKPSSNLASGLYDQETAEAFAQLEYRRRPSQHLIPGPHSHCLG